jgi:uncharacterized membrane protein
VAAADRGHPAGDRPGHRPAGVLDEVLDSGHEPLTLVFEGGPVGARGILSTIAGSVISVVTLLFSLTIVTLQLASSQYSPGCCRPSCATASSRCASAPLLATFVYSLSGAAQRAVGRRVRRGLGLRAPPVGDRGVRLRPGLGRGAGDVPRPPDPPAPGRDDDARRPRRVHRHHRAAAAQLDGDSPDGPLPDVPAHARPLCARASGFLVQTAEGPLPRGAVRLRGVLRLGPPSGRVGRLAARRWPGRGPTPQRRSHRSTRSRRRCSGTSRSPSSGPGGRPRYGLRKLVDVAARALSPGINDPTTAVHALSHVSALMAQLSTRDTWHRQVAGDDGVRRLLLPSWDHAALLDLSLTQVRSYGRQDTTVVERLFALLAEVGWQARTERQRAAVRTHCAALTAQSLEEVPAGRTEDDVRRMAGAVERALAGRWEPLST